MSRRRSKPRPSQPGLFDAPATRRKASSPELAASLPETSLSAEHLRREIVNLLNQRRSGGATEAELLHALRVAPRLLAARLQELVQDGEVIQGPRPVADEGEPVEVFLLSGWASEGASGQCPGAG